MLYRQLSNIFYSVECLSYLQGEWLVCRLQLQFFHQKFLQFSSLQPIYYSLQCHNNRLNPSSCTVCAKKRFFKIISKLLHEIMFLSASKLLSKLGPKTLLRRTEHSEPGVSREIVKQKSALERVLSRQCLISSFPPKSVNVILIKYISQSYPQTWLSFELLLS